MTRTLIAYHSRTGHTRTLAEGLAEELGADRIEIHDQADRCGLGGAFGAAADAWRERPAEIDLPKIDFSAYDRIVVGGPVWAWNMSPAVRAFLKRYREALPEKVAFFLTEGGAGAERTFRKMTELLGRAPDATLIETDADRAAGEAFGKRAEFVDALNAADLSATGAPTSSNAPLEPS